MQLMEKEVNPHFEDFLFDWDQKFQFLVGGYGSSKSYHIALKLILKLLDEKRTALVIRKSMTRTEIPRFLYLKRKVVIFYGGYLLEIIMRELLFIIWQ